MALSLPLGVQAKLDHTERLPQEGGCTKGRSSWEEGPTEEGLMGEDGQHFSGALVPYHDPGAVAQL